MARVRDREEERLEDSNIELVIQKLHSTEKPITKKEACAILNISYNTARLEKIIQGYVQKQENRAKRRSEKRGKPATIDEVQDVILSYLKGEVISTLAEQHYRSPGFIKRILEQYSVPIRATSSDYFKPELVPEGAIRERFNVGERVYSVRYDSLATIKSEQPHKYGGFVYLIWLEDDKWQENAYQPAYELASLEHLKALGIRL
jgi:hypothetical protein